ncbi:MAG: hypothetical protein ACQZ3M_00145, partial [cyanobacterium endosymbiont of Rhopalodia fuxianensis]
MPRRMINSSYNLKSSAINNDSYGRSTNGKSSSSRQQINSVSEVGGSTKRLPRRKVSTLTKVSS